MFAARKTDNVSSAANYIEDVFSTYLYTGTSATRTITNNIDLSTYGGMVWTKGRNYVVPAAIFDTVRGANQVLRTNSTNAQASPTDALTGFTSSGYTLGADASDWGVNYSPSYNYVSWTFRKQAKFFDVVTWTGDGTNPRTINHNLGSTPGCIIIKCTSSGVADWPVWHRSLSTQGGFLNTVDAFSSGLQYFGVTVTSTTFSLNSANVRTNQSGATYVAYLFAHDAGGFGATGTDNVISCGSFTTDVDGVATVNLGYEPQWVMVKSSSDSAIGWQMLDIMRGWVTGTTVASSDDARLDANSSSAEFTGQQRGNVTSTGFVYRTGSASQTCIYIAIRRGPMKTPTSGTSVFSPVARTGTSAAATISGVGFAPDFAAIKARSTNSNNTWLDKLRGAVRLQSDTTNPEDNYLSGITSWNNDGISLGAAGHVNGSPETFINYLFRRAPGFFDVVCYTGTGSATTFNHNLTVVPELMIVKSRNNATNWAVYCAYLGGANPANRYVLLNSSQSLGGTAVYWNDTAPTSTVFTVGTTAATNTSSYTYVNYLFATVVGVSKVGSYTGTGTTKQIDCGFTAGARFVMIKRTDSTGDWYVWDTARGIVSGNDPYLLLNSTAAEVTSTDYIDPLNAGFEISSAAPADINANGGTFIFLAIA